MTAKRVKNTVLYAALALLGVILLYPVFFGLLGSLSTPSEFYKAVVLPVPHSPFKQFADNYQLIFTDETLLRALAVTFGKMAWGLIISVPVSVLLGFVFAKMRFPLKRTFFLILMSSMMIPGPAMIIPNYIWMARFPLMGGNNIVGQGGTGFLNNPWMFVLTGWVGVYNIFLCRQCFATLGNEMNEAAEIDGAGFLRTVFTIYMPLVTPILAVMFLNSFVGSWNDYLGNLIYMPDAKQWWTVGNVFVDIMAMFSDASGLTQPNYPAAFGVAFVSMVPPIVAYACVQEQFTKGLAMGAVKG
ncbi:MAG: carbohydrate ABC transporter permease [Clostridiales bacterium]|jgi:multiple sugar transport system permease protein|nr:carbohydrate ABC transporter permease [Clostridiales bacterium]